MTCSSSIQTASSKNVFSCNGTKNLTILRGNGKRKAVKETETPLIEAQSMDDDKPMVKKNNNYIIGNRGKARGIKSNCL